MSENICFECGNEGHEKHHVVPRSKGGTKTVCLCSYCHGLVHGVNRLNISELSKAALAAKKERGEKMGTPANLTTAAREKGREAHSVNAANNPNTKQAKEYAVMLRCKGLSLRQMAETLNAEGFKTPRGGTFSAVQVARLLNLVQSEL